MSYAVTLTPGGDITAKVDAKSIKRTTRLYNELKPAMSRVDFRMEFDASVFSSLVTSEEVAVAITKDGAAYFTGTLSPNYSTVIEQGRKFLGLIAEDYTITKLGKPLAAPIQLMEYAVCDPAAPSASVVHALCSAAGVTLASGCPTIAYVLPFLSIIPDDKRTIADILADLLYCYNYTYRFNAAGELVLDQAVNTGDITTPYGFNSANLRGSIEVKKVRERYDDIRVKHKAVEFKAGLTLFEDRTGATGSYSCYIKLEANGDPSGGDYYPRGSRDSEIFAEYASPEGYEILCATSARLDAVHTAPFDAYITQDPNAITNYGKRASFVIRNPFTPWTYPEYPFVWNGVVYLTRVRITGSAYVVVAENTARCSVSSAKKRHEYDAEYIYEIAYAQALARELNQYYKNSTHSYTVRSHDDIPLGAYALLEDTVFSGISQKCRIVGKVEDAATKSITYDLESVADFASVDLITEGTARPVGSSAADQLALMADDSIITPQEKNSVKTNWISVNGDGSTTGSYWSTRIAAQAAGVPTDSIDLARAVLNAQLFDSPGVLKLETWDQNITITSDFFDAWASYYQNEAALIATITKYGSYGVMEEIDCGVYDGSAPVARPELDFGSYVLPGATPDATTDCGEYDGSAPDPEATYDFGDYSAVSPSSATDFGVYVTPSTAYIPPSLAIDCGVVPN